MRKPVLYHDIDGVLFGEYGPRQDHQLRPGVNDWFHWVLRRYELVFLTSWNQPALIELLKSLYLDKVLSACRYLPWNTVGIPFKWDALQQDFHRHRMPFLWIDDDPAVFPSGEIRSQYYSAIPFVRVNPTGAHELDNLQQRLNARTKKLTQHPEVRTVPPFTSLVPPLF